MSKGWIGFYETSKNKFNEKIGEKKRFIGYLQENCNSENRRVN
jgi:hypothetical protein